MTSSPTYPECLTSERQNLRNPDTAVESASKKYKDYTARREAVKQEARGRQATEIVDTGKCSVVCT
jgi:hypothetical protein